MLVTPSSSNPRRPRVAFARPWLWQVSFPLVLFGLVGAGAWSLVRPRPIEPLPPPPPGRPGIRVPELVPIAPGTVIGEQPPAGWTHRLVCTRMSIDSGDLHRLPMLARVTASRIRTAMLAEVRRTPGPLGFYHLKRIGVGLTLEHRGENLAVSPDSVDRLGVPMSIVDRFVLGRAEEAVERGRLAARTPTFALYDASIEFVDRPSDEHQSMFLRHALLVDPNTGQLHELVWRMAEKPEERTPPAAVIEVPWPLDFPCGIHVKALTIAGKIPIGWLFAMTAIPSGTPIPVEPETAAKLLADPDSPEESEGLELVLRAILNSRDATSPGWIAPDSAAPSQHHTLGADVAAQSSPSTPSL